MKRNTVLFFFVLWVILLTSGMAYMMRHDLRSGADGNAPALWPQGSRLERRTGKPTLVMFAHPKCPCTRASLDELQELVDKQEGSLTTYVVLFRPAESANDWTQAPLWQKAASIPGVTVLDDPAGTEAGRFGSVTSGDVLLYDAGGRLTFQGGITAARGHTGPNAGAVALRRYFEKTEVTRARTPVFGCSLLTSP